MPDPQPEPLTLAPEETRSRPGALSTSLDRWMARRLLEAAGRPPLRIVLWDGSEVQASADPPVARLVVRSRGALVQMLLDPELRFGEAYSAGTVEVQGDLVGMLEMAYRAARGTTTGATQLLRRLRSFRTNTQARARHNIHHHYDLGNDFYRLWLDDEMAYTCAYFPTPTATLEEAQLAKFDLVCRKLQLRSGEKVVEAGCGWGGLALHMARCYGATVRAYNISKEQVAFARARARAEGLDDRVEFVEDDYRNISGRYDAFVSVGMLEHVGREHYRDLGRVIRTCLTESGRGLIHSIGRNRPVPLNRWIEKRIFPGAYPPTLREMVELLEPHGFSVVDVENLRLHYAKTIEHWLTRYERCAGQVAETFEPHFARAWRLYLAGSLAAFTTGWLQLFQVVFTQPQDNQGPWTRAHLYAS